MGLALLLNTTQVRQSTELLLRHFTSRSVLIFGPALAVSDDMILVLVSPDSEKTTIPITIIVRGSCKGTKLINELI